MYMKKVGFRVRFVHHESFKMLVVYKPGYHFPIIISLTNQNLRFSESYRNILSWSSSSRGEKELSREISRLLIERSLKTNRPEIQMASLNLHIDDLHAISYP